MIIHALQTILHLNKKYLDRLYIRQIFLIQLEYCLQRMDNHMVGRAASFVSPFYFILLDSTVYTAVFLDILLWIDRKIHIIIIIKQNCWVKFLAPGNPTHQHHHFRYAFYIMLVSELISFYSTEMHNITGFMFVGVLWTYFDVQGCNARKVNYSCVYSTYTKL